MINIPLAQSIRFRPINTARANFDNTFAATKDTFNYSFDYYLPASDVKIQIVTPDDNTSYSYLDLIHGTTRTRITDLATTFIGQLKYETYTIDLGTYPNECCYLEAFLEEDGGGEVLSYRSEPFHVTTQDNYLLIEWLNSENSFQMDYSTGLTHMMQLEAKQWKMSFGGESSVYVNQGEEVKLKGIVQRIFLLECELPDYLAEILVLAMEHDSFYINEVEFVVSKKATITQMGQSGMYSFSAEVKQKTIVGLNTHDVG